MAEVELDRDRLEELDPRARHYRADATLWVWIGYGLAQATITMLMAFDVIKELTAAEVCTAVSLIIYVAVNELIVRPGRRRRRSAPGEQLAALPGPEEPERPVDTP
jgi:hypothetical protein